MNKIPNFLRKSANELPDKIALEFENEKWTFKQLNDKVVSIGEKLVSVGVQSGETVALYGSNRPETVFLIHALFYIGAKVLLLNTRLTNRELNWQLNHAQIQKVVAVKEVSFEKVDCINWEDLVHVTGKTFPIKEYVDQDEVATIMYTSGTTGFPKAVLQTYGNHFHSAISSCQNLKLDNMDKWLCITPLYHVSGLSIFMRSSIIGLSVYLQDGFDAKLAVQAIEQKGVTIASVVTHSLERIMKEFTLVPDYFKGMLLGGGPAPLSLLEECRDKGISVFLSYGMTETCSQIVTLPPADVLRKMGSAGKPIPGCKVKIVEENNELEAMASGEIAVKGPNVTSGYMYGEKPESFRDGWFYTGDIGYLDEEGYLFVQDRRSDLIISGGENVYPAEIESVLKSFPAVVDAAVVGMEDEKWGSVPVAFLVLDKLVSIETISCYCCERLAKYKVPKKFFIVKDLPKNATGKLLRKELREELHKRKRR